MSSRRRRFQSRVYGLPPTGRRHRGRTSTCLTATVVYGYRGSPSWIFVAIYRPYRSTSYTVELVMTSGKRVPLPSLRLDARTGSAGQAISVDLHLVSGVRLVGANRRH